MLSTVLIVSQRKWRCLNGAVLNIKFGPFYVFSSVFSTPPRYDYPLDATLVLWQYESRIREGLLYICSIFKQPSPRQAAYCIPHGPPPPQLLAPAVTVGERRELWILPLG